MQEILNEISKYRKITNLQFLISEILISLVSMNNPLRHILIVQECPKEKTINNIVLETRKIKIFIVCIW